jgi:hypothetical protein
MAVAVTRPSYAKTVLFDIKRQNTVIAARWAIISKYRKRIFAVAYVNTLNVIGLEQMFATQAF